MYKSAFSVPHAYGLEIFQNNSLSSNLGRWSDECMAILMLTPTDELQKLALICGTRKLLIFRRSTSVGHVVDVTADVKQMIFFCVAAMGYSLFKVFRCL